MKRLNKLLCLLLISLLPAAGFSKDGVKHAFTPQESVRSVEITFIENYGDITILGTEGAQIEIVAEDYQEPDDENEENGYSSVFSGGRDNTGIGLSIEEDKDSVKIMGLPNIDSSDYTIHIPNRYSLKVNNIGYGDSIIQNFKGEIEVAVAEGDAVIKDITGPATLHNMNGDLVVHFSEVSQDAPTSITNLNGDTVVSIPEDTQANLQMKSLNSDIRTNLNIDYDTPNLDRHTFNIGQRTVTGKLNGGGVLISLEAINGDIVLKKGGDNPNYSRSSSDFPKPPKPPKPLKNKSKKHSPDGALEVEEVEEVEEFN